MDEVEVVLRQGTSAEWAASGLILGQAEMGYDTDLDQTKVGDGVSAWADLPFVGGSGLLGGLLSGGGPPGSGSGLDALDGINDPWRWADYPPIGGWVGSAFEVTVTEGAVLDLSGESIPAGAVDVSLYLTTGTTLTEANNGLHTILTWDVGEATTASVSFSSLSLAHAAADATGLAFLVQYETDYEGPTVVPDATLNLADYLGAGFTIGDPYEFPDVSTGEDGQFYIDTTTRDLWGPRASGVWTKLSTLPAPA